ncbi:MAG TPA: hypothetical protein P5081_16870 [Phycisphaerae bacterium]|nr:hypothetical protein [Phycisphaerae bacterium]HRW54545.1 hypothetical protein [Phycisphaerae bacterium]
MVRTGSPIRSDGAQGNATGHRVMGESGTPSRILLDELFAAEDDRLLSYLRNVRVPTLLSTVVERLKSDTRDWARRQIIAYFEEPLDCRGHELVVKRLFKHAEERGDDEIMGVCAVAFDRVVRRVRRRRYYFDSVARSDRQGEFLTSPHNRIAPHIAEPRPRGAYGGPADDYRPRVDDRLFTYRTRYYLRRRVWRYFRFLGYSNPDRYVPGIAHALRRFTDADFEVGENIIDNWTLMHACFAGNEAIEFTASHVRLAEGRSLSELRAAPDHDDLWRRTEAFDALIDLVGAAQSSLVRQWAIELTHQHHAPLLKSLSPARLIRLLGHSDERVQSFAADAFANLDSLSSVGIDEWLSLTDVSNHGALSMICDAMRRHVSMDRLTTEQLVALACARPSPVAQLGLEWLRTRHNTRPVPPNALSGLANAACASIAAEMGEWALSVLGTFALFDVEFITPFFDSSLAPMRGAALAWLDESSLGWNEPALWTRLIETPFDDVRLGVVQRLERRRSLPGRCESDRLAPVWAAVILSVHRGGRRKPDALRQIVRAIEREPAQAERLLPVIAIAMRSIRPTERRAALAAVASMLSREPAHAAIVARIIPELEAPQAMGGAA